MRRDARGGLPVSCGFVNLPNSKFCSECATPLTSTAPAAAAVQRPAAPPAGAQSERKLVTVLFADLVGFTPFAEERDAEDVRDTLTRYFDLAREVIERYGGTVEKFIGDAVMAVWGAPDASQLPEYAYRASRPMLWSAWTLPSPILRPRYGRGPQRLRQA